MIIVKYLADLSLRDNSRRIILITLTLNHLEISLCDIFAPNNHTNQLKVSQDLKIYLKDKSDVSLSWTRSETKKPHLHLLSTPLQPRLVPSIERFDSRHW